MSRDLNELFGMTDPQLRDRLNQQERPRRRLRVPPPASPWIPELLAPGVFHVGPDRDGRIRRPEFNLLSDRSLQPPSIDQDLCAARPFPLPAAGQCLRRERAPSLRPTLSGKVLLDRAQHINPGRVQRPLDVPSIERQLPEPPRQPIHPVKPASSHPGSPVLTRKPESELPAFQVSGFKSAIRASSSQISGFE